VHLSANSIDARTEQGTWALDAIGATISLAIENSSNAGSIEVALQDDGRIAIGGEVVEIVDQRAFCDDIALDARLTATLEGSVYSFPLRPGSPLRSSLTLCASGRYVLRNPVARRGRWFVGVRDGVGELQLVEDTTDAELDFPIEEADDGTVVVDGETPFADPSDLLAQRCS
jgi:hypothetical protein